MLALSIRQPYVELILRGMKTVEFRSRATRRVGERFYLYAAWPKTRDERLDARALAMPPLAAMSCVARALGGTGNVRAIAAADHMPLPAGVIVGTAVIDDCSYRDGWYHWRLSAPRRLKRPRKPKRHPQPTWFKPF